MGKRVFSILVLALACSSMQAQKCITTHFTAMIIQGEAMGRGMIGDDLGLGVNIAYGHAIGSKTQVLIAASHLRYNVDYMQPGGDNSSYYYGTGSHTSAGAGLMFFPFSKRGRAAMYSQFRPYVAATGGIVMQNNQTVDAINLPSGFTLYEGNRLLPYGEILFGIKLRMSPNLSFDVFAGGRSTMTDGIDGIAGTGAAPDIIGRVGFGICSKLR